MDRLEKTVHSAIKNHVFPGAVIGVIANDKRTVQAFGRETYDVTAPKVTANTVYDLASITKCIPTASLALHFIEQGALNLDDPIVRFLPQIQAQNRGAITLRNLLTYTVAFKLPLLSRVARKGGRAILGACYRAELVAEPGAIFLYNNLVATLLALIVEKAGGKKFTILADEILFGPLGMHSTTFTPKTAAPTEINKRGIVAAQVHDESAWALTKAGLTTGHAGLFSTADDLLKFADMLLKNGDNIFKPTTIECMHTNQLAPIHEIFGLGWAMPGGQFDFFGSHVSPQAFGMTGFTGTSFLVDPVKKRALVILSNATFPKRKGDKEIINAVRRELADIVFSE